MPKLPFSNIQGLSPELLQAVADMGYREMTPIQQNAIPLLLQGKDVIGRSSTGTGKTAAFGLPAVQSIQGPSVPAHPFVLIMAPTRELAMQIAAELQKYAKYKRQVQVACIFGGQNMDIQIRALKRAQIVVGTPGRIMDHMRRRTLKLDNVQMVVLDEADEMLNMGFIEDIRTILGDAPLERQTVLFSATMPPAIMEITRQFQNEPALVAVDEGKRTLSTIEQCWYQAPQARKADALNLLLQYFAPKRSIVFCNTKKMVDELVSYLNQNAFKSLGLHGDMRQSQRTGVMNEFKSGRANILVATDVAARGIDVDDIEAVFNYDIPAEYEHYIHRIGRTGRAGKEGKSLSLVSNRAQVLQIQNIQNYIGAPIVLKQLPQAEDILNKNREKLVNKLKTAYHEPGAQRYTGLVQRLISEGYDPMQLVCAAVLLGDKKAQRPIPHIPTASFGGGKTAKALNGRSLVKVNIGSMHGVAPNFIVGAIVEGCDIPSKAIGKIDIYPEHTLIDMAPQDAQLVVSQMKKAKIKGRSVVFTVCGEKSKADTGRRSAGSEKSQRRKPFKGKKHTRRV